MLRKIKGRKERDAKGKKKRKERCDISRVQSRLFGTCKDENVNKQIPPKKVLKTQRVSTTRRRSGGRLERQERRGQKTVMFKGKVRIMLCRKQEKDTGFIQCT